MEKVTDRILWSILVLAIGVGIFVVGKPAFVNLTNQVLHRDDLKATMQSPAVSSVSSWQLQSTDPVNSGLSSHGYALQSTKGMSDDDLWWRQARGISMPSEVRDVPIPYNSYAKFLFKIKANEPLTIMFDVNNTALTGSNWGYNDNDEVSRRRLTVDGKTTSIGTGPNQTLLSANTWHTVEVIYFNTNPANVHQVALSDYSALNFMNNTDHKITFKLDDFRYAVDNQKYL